MTQHSLVTQAFAVARDHAGLALDDRRREHARALVEAWLTRYGVREPGEIAPGAELDDLLEGLVIHESYFDRDLEQLRFVDEVLLADLSRTHANLRVWSAGCAAGEEPYSIAFFLQARGLLDRTSLLATDLSDAALARARLGRYRGWAVRTGSETPAMRYLETSGAELVVPEAIRARVRFQRLNLVADLVPRDQHLVVCRNVLIYFDADALATVATKLASALSEDGTLVVAPSDPRLDALADLEITVAERCVYYRRRRARAAAVAPVHRAPPPPVRVLPRPIAVPPPRPPSLIAQVRALADHGSYEPALVLLHQALAASPLEAELHFLNAVLLLDREPAAALAALERAIYLAPDAPLPLLFAGRLHHTRGDTRSARRAYRHAIQLLAALPAEAAVPWSTENARELGAAARAAVESLRG